MIESRENPDAKGDFTDKADPNSNQALGLFQHHPATFQEYYGRSHLFPASPAHTWVEAEILAMASFFEIWEDSIGVDLTVQAHNLGVEGVMRNGLRNAEYLERFTAAFQKVRALAV